MRPIKNRGTRGQRTITKGNWFRSTSGLTFLGNPYIKGPLFDPYLGSCHSFTGGVRD